MQEDSSNSTQQISGLAPLLDGFGRRHVGNVVTSTFDEVTILTTDRWKHDVGGLPATGLLLASSHGADDIGSIDSAERSALLLRINGPTDLPIDQDRTRSVIENFRRKQSVEPGGFHDGMDAITHDFLQWHGMSASILGTFFEDEAGRLRFGSDIEDFHVTSGLRVFKPTPQALDLIVNYVDPDRKAAATEDAAKAGFAKELRPIEFARVRYTSTNRLSKASGDADVPVRIWPIDFIARRTAIFGMTRTGKSNTVKTLISMVQLAACDSQVPIGQLIFDVAGEYANANGQDDGSSISDVFFDNVVRYRGVPTPGFHDLRDNFYLSLTDGLGFAQSLVRDAVGSSPSQDMSSFLEMDLADPGPNAHRERHHWERRRALWWCILKMGRLEPGSNFGPVCFEFGQAAASQFGALLADSDGVALLEDPIEFFFRRLGNPKDGLTIDQACIFFKTVRELELRNRDNHKSNDEQQRKKDPPPPKPEFPSPIWLAAEEVGLANLLAAESSNRGNIRGFRFICDNIRNYHSAGGAQSIADDVYDELSRGRIVILDLSVGAESVRIKRAETIARKIFNRSFDRFTSGQSTSKIVLYVEEAHNLIGRDAKPDDTWPRIAKEGAKAGLALVYATQEPSAIAPFIRAATENVVTTHLNNDDEVRSMSRYYDFSAYERSIKRSQDVGFARIKTLSSSFVIPVQIVKFKPKEMKAEYGAADRPRGFEAVKPPPEILPPQEEPPDEPNTAAPQSSLGWRPTAPQRPAAVRRPASKTSVFDAAGGLLLDMAPLGPRRTGE